MSNHGPNLESNLQLRNQLQQAHTPAGAVQKKCIDFQKLINQDESRGGLFSQAVIKTSQIGGFDEIINSTALSPVKPVH